MTALTTGCAVVRCPARYRLRVVHGLKPRVAYFPNLIPRLAVFPLPLPTTSPPAAPSPASCCLLTSAAAAQLSSPPSLHLHPP